MSWPRIESLHGYEGHLWSMLFLVGQKLRIAHVFQHGNAINDQLPLGQNGEKASTSEAYYWGVSVLTCVDAAKTADYGIAQERAARFH